ncbi:hypothetical protein P692DRAFT_20871091 [Suillus brevipes Sb2]|nr:hypothetical protein P692DRAFT_20871091 [Suillus brevipes Sb2]
MLVPSFSHCMSAIVDCMPILRAIFGPSSIYNPPNLDLATGDLLATRWCDPWNTTDARSDAELGINSVQSTSAFNPNSSPEGLQTLSQCVGGQDVELSIVGYSGSPQVISLLEAFESMNITAMLPGLNSSFLLTGVLESDRIPHQSLHRRLRHHQHLIKVTSHGLYLGSINTTMNFNSAGKSTTKSPVLMNYDPPTLFTLTRVLAVQAGLDPTQLDGIVALGGYQGFNLPDFADQAFKQLRSDIQLLSQLTIGANFAVNLLSITYSSAGAGDYATTLSYTQTDVPISMDSSLNLILLILAKPTYRAEDCRWEHPGVINLCFFVANCCWCCSMESVLIIDPQETTFGTQLNGSIMNAGPFDATITFNDGVVISWGGQPIGLMKIDPVHVVGDVGAMLNVQSTFEVVNVDYFASFTQVKDYAMWCIFF